VLRVRKTVKKVNKVDKMMKKGLFGCSLSNQVIVIGVAYCALSLMGIVFGFLLVAHPEKFSGVSQVHPEKFSEVSQNPEKFSEVSQTTQDPMPRGVSEFNSSLQDDQDVEEESSAAREEVEEEVTEEVDLMYGDETFEEEEEEGGENAGNGDERGAEENLSTQEASEGDQEEEEGEEEDKDEVRAEDPLEEDIEVPQSEEERRHLRQLVKHIQGDGVEVLIESALSLTCSLVLLHGVRTNRHWLLLPWLLDTMMEMVAGFLQVTVQAASEQWAMSTTQILGVVLFYFLGGYCLYSVASYQVLLRRMNKNSDQIINSVCQAGGFQDLVGGRNYRRLEEEVWQSEPNLGQELRRAQPQDGFTREKKVGDEGHPDQDEHVLYVQF